MHFVLDKKTQYMKFTFKMKAIHSVMVTHLHFSNSPLAYCFTQQSHSWYMFILTYMFITLHNFHNNRFSKLNLNESTSKTSHSHLTSYYSKE